MNLLNGDCLKIIPKLKLICDRGPILGRPKDTVDLVSHEKLFDKVKLVVVDLPYGQTNCDWDTPIDLAEMWNVLKPICKRNCIYIFFCTTKFGYTIISSKPQWFRYDLVWEKSRKVGHLLANKMPLRKHEMIYVFIDPNNDDLNNSRNLGLREYAESVKEYINTPLKEIDEVVNNQGIHHFYSFKSTQFGLPTKKTYDALIAEYGLDEMDGFRNLDDLKKKWCGGEKKLTYNAQKTKGKPYVSSNKPSKSGVYSATRGAKNTVNKGDRHPSSIIKYGSPNTPLHSTQKPVDLLEWLIKSYSNEGDTVLDFTMGSGSTGIACLNTNRKFIGIEKDPCIFKIARSRIVKHN